MSNLSNNVPIQSFQNIKANNSSVFSNSGTSTDCESSILKALIREKTPEEGSSMALSNLVANVSAEPQTVYVRNVLNVGAGTVFTDVSGVNPESKSFTITSSGDPVVAEGFNITLTQNKILSSSSGHSLEVLSSGEDADAFLLAQLKNKDSYRNVQLSNVLPASSTTLEDTLRVSSNVYSTQALNQSEKLSQYGLQATLSEGDLEYGLYRLTQTESNRTVTHRDGLHNLSGSDATSIEGDFINLNSGSDSSVNGLLILDGSSNSQELTSFKGSILVSDSHFNSNGELLSNPIEFDTILIKSEAGGLDLTSDVDLVLQSVPQQDVQSSFWNNGGLSNTVLLNFSKGSDSLSNINQNDDGLSIDQDEKDESLTSSEWGSLDVVQSGSFSDRRAITGTFAHVDDVLVLYDGDNTSSLSSYDLTSTTTISSVLKTTSDVSYDIELLHNSTNGVVENSDSSHYELVDGSGVQALNAAAVTFQAKASIDLSPEFTTIYEIVGGNPVATSDINVNSSKIEISGTDYRADQEVILRFKNFSDLTSQNSYLTSAPSGSFTISESISGLKWEPLATKIPYVIPNGGYTSPLTVSYRLKGDSDGKHNQLLQVGTSGGLDDEVVNGFFRTAIDNKDESIELWDLAEPVQSVSIVQGLDSSQNTISYSNLISDLNNLSLPSVASGYIQEQDLYVARGSTVTTYHVWSKLINIRQTVQMEDINVSYISGVSGQIQFDFKIKKTLFVNSSTNNVETNFSRYRIATTQSNGLGAFEDRTLFQLVDYPQNSYDLVLQPSFFKATKLSLRKVTGEQILGENDYDIFDFDDKSFVDSDPNNEVSLNINLDLDTAQTYAKDRTYKIAFNLDTVVPQFTASLDIYDPANPLNGASVDIAASLLGTGTTAVNNNIQYTLSIDGTTLVVFNTLQFSLNTVVFRYIRDPIYAVSKDEGQPTNTFLQVASSTPKTLNRLDDGVYLVLSSEGSVGDSFNISLTQDDLSVKLYNGLNMSNSDVDMSNLPIVYSDVKSLSLARHWFRGYNNTINHILSRPVLTHQITTKYNDGTSGPSTSNTSTQIFSDSTITDNNELLGLQIEITCNVSNLRSSRVLQNNPSSPHRFIQITPSRFEVLRGNISSSSTLSSYKILDDNSTNVLLSRSVDGIEILKNRAFLDESVTSLLVFKIYSIVVEKSTVVDQVSTGFALTQEPSSYSRWSHVANQKLPLSFSNLTIDFVNQANQTGITNNNIVYIHQYPAINKLEYLQSIDNTVYNVFQLPQTDIALDIPCVGSSGGNVSVKLTYPSDLTSVVELIPIEYNVTIQSLSSHLTEYYSNLLPSVLQITIQQVINDAYLSSLSGSDLGKIKFTFNRRAKAGSYELSVEPGNTFDSYVYFADDYYVHDNDGIKTKLNRIKYQGIGVEMFDSTITNGVVVGNLSSSHLDYDLLDVISKESVLVILNDISSVSNIGWQADSSVQTPGLVIHMDVTKMQSFNDKFVPKTQNVDKWIGFIIPPALTVQDTAGNEVFRVRSNGVIVSRAVSTYDIRFAEQSSNHTNVRDMRLAKRIHLDGSVRFQNI